MKRFTLLSLSALLLFAFASVAMAQSKAYNGYAFGYVPKDGSAQAKVESFDFLIDNSGSMMMKHKVLNMEKFALGKRAVERINEHLPNLDYAGGIHTFATNKEVLPISKYDKANFAKALASMKSRYDVFNHLTPMGDDLQAWAQARYNSMSSPSAVIIVSDGENNRGTSALAAAQAALAANSGLVFHVISVADTAAGQANLDQIVNLNSNGESVSVDAIQLLTNDDVLYRFISDVFLGHGKLVLRSVLFAFNSSKITPDSAAVLDELASMIKEVRVPIEIGGHTDSIGSEKYNYGLSLRRAGAVKSYLVKQGIPTEAISVVGYGKLNPKYDNSTEDGRRLNRRAEIDFTYRLSGAGYRY